MMLWNVTFIYGLLYARVSKIPGTRLPGRLNFVLWGLFAGPQGWTCFMAPCWGFSFDVS